MHKIYNWKKFLRYVAPITILYTMFMFVPIIMAFRYSLTNYRGIGKYAFVGLDNYIRLFKAKTFYMSLTNTLKSTIVTVCLILPLSFLCAFFLRETTKRYEVYKTIIFVPYTMGGIIIGLIWKFILNPSNGLINNLLTAVGLENLTQQWIGGKTLTPYSVGIIGVWSGLGFCTLLWISGMKQISSDIIEASMIDGASRGQQIRLIFIPLLKDTFKMLFVMQFTGCLKVFETVQMLTGGGPNHYSETMVSFMYNTTFTERFFGYGMSIAVVEFVISLIITFIFLRLTKKEVTE